MESQQLIQQIERLPASAQRLVAELVALLSQQLVTELVGQDTVSQEPQGATILPPLNLENVPATWPENPFADPAFYGVWADREDMKDGGAAYIHAVRRGLRSPR